MTLSSSAAALESALSMLLKPMGVRAVGPGDRKVTHSEGDDTLRITLAMPTMYVGEDPQPEVRTPL